LKKSEEEEKDGSRVLKAPACGLRVYLNSRQEA
jgi:hypothetical protein